MLNMDIECNLSRKEMKSILDNLIFKVKNT